MSHDDFRRMLREIKRDQELLNSQAYDELTTLTFTVRGQVHTVFYTPETQGGGSYVLPSLGRELDRLRIQPGKILECFCGPAFLGFYSLAKFPQAKLVLTDKNPKVADLIQRTVRTGNYKQVHQYLGDGLAKVPRETFDLVLANPPWWPESTVLVQRVKNNLTPRSKEILFLDEDFKAHKQFFRDLHAYVHEKTVVILLEGREMAPRLAALAAREGFSSELRSIDFLQPLEKLLSEQGTMEEFWPVWIFLSPSRT